MNWQNPVRNVMTRAVTFALTTDLIKDVQEIFLNNPFHHLPITDNHKKVKGILSRQDYQKIVDIFTTLKDLRVELTSENFSLSMTAEDVMTKHVVTIHQDDTIDFAWRIFREDLFHAMPVIDHQHRLVGILSTYDLLNYAYQ